MMEDDREKSAQEYLTKHKIPQLLENLTADLVFQRPENPKAFMIEYIKKLMESRTTGMNHPRLFDDSNVRTLFGMLDVTSQGHINYEQYKQALENMGVKNFDRNPSGVDTNQISLDVFLKEARNGLTKSSATFLST